MGKDKEKIIAYILTPKDYAEKIARVNRKIPKKNKVIYVTLSRSCNKILEQMDPKKEYKNFFFIGSGKPHEEQEKHPPCVHIPPANSLVALSPVIREAVQTIKGEKTLVIESMGALIASNDSGVLEDFLRMIIALDVPTIFFVMQTEETTEKVKQFMTFVDEVKGE